MIRPFLSGIEIQFEVCDIEDFATPVVAYIASDKDSKGTDCFYFSIMTPKRLTKMLSETKILSGRCVFIVNGPDMKTNIEIVKAKINKILEECARETWEEVALAINCFLAWEYYDPAVGICDFYKDTMKKVESGEYAPSTLTIEEIYEKYCNRDVD